MGRIDIHIEVPAVKYKDLANRDPGEPSRVLGERNNRARKIQSQRFKGSKIHCNAQMTNRHIKRLGAIDDESQRLLEMAIDKLGLSARAYTRILKVGRTIADLAREEEISSAHISRACNIEVLPETFYIEAFFVTLSV